MSISTIWSLDPHTRAKHVILRKYLNAWLPILSRYNGRVVYVDGFAGPGVYQNGEDGSPIVALRAHSACLICILKGFETDRNRAGLFTSDLLRWRTRKTFSFTT